MANIVGTDDYYNYDNYDLLQGSTANDTIIGGQGDDTLTGGGGKDKFIYNLGDGTDTITDFSGVGKGRNPTAAVIAEMDTIKFQGAGLTAPNLLLTQNGTDLEITFERKADAIVILQNFKLENLENLKASGAKPSVGNILFDGQTTIADSFDVIDANSTQTNIFNKNTVTFFNDLNNNITGFDNSNDVINGQGGNDKINGLSGNDLLRGGAGDDTLIGGVGNDSLIGGRENDSIVGNNLLSGGYGNDYLSISGYYEGNDYENYDSQSSGNNTLNGGAGKDTLSAGGSIGDNLLSGGDGNDYLSISGDYSYTSGNPYEYRDVSITYESRSSGNSTLNGGAGDDNLNATNSKGDNLLSGGAGNDYK